MRNEYVVAGIILVSVGIGLAIVFAAPMTEKMPVIGDIFAEERYKEITNPAGFVNTSGITIGELVGKKVVLVDFLTYSCINCQRTFPYLNAWYKKYKDQGLEIIGIHTPEFAFEKDIENVRRAMNQFGIVHPIVLDNDYATWRAYGNQYWPRKYLIDIRGDIVYDHIGEGAYEETEMKIRELLGERAKVLGEGEMPNEVPLAASEISKIQNFAQSPETYFGSKRNEYLANGLVGRPGVQTLKLPATFKPNALYLGGTWNFTPEHAAATTGASVVYRYYGKEVYIVASSETPVGMEVWQDGKLIGAEAGEDVDKNGIVTVQASRLYKLIRNPEAGDHVLELRIKDPGALLFAFTFG